VSLIFVALLFYEKNLATKLQ